MRRRILLVSPAFHRYWESIARGLEANGYDVVPFVYDEHATAAGKVRNKLEYELPSRVGLAAGRRRQARDATQRAIAAVRTSGADGVIAIRSDLFLDALWDEIDARKLPKLLWLYDEHRRTTHTLDTMRRFDAVATYSRHDLDELRAAGVDAFHLPNAFDPSMQPAAPPPRDDIVFVGARYPGRERTLTELHRRGVPVHAVGRDWSHHPFDRARTWQWRRPAVPASRDVDRGEAYAVLAGAAAALNLHEDQDGFTMRTFETAGVGGCQLIDRSDVDEIYEPGEEILTFASLPELEALCRRALDDRGWARGIGAAARRRTLAEHTFAHRMKELTQRWA